MVLDDEYFAWAITAVDLGGDSMRAERWFAALESSATDESGARRDWDGFSAELRVEGLNADVAESQIDEYLETLSSNFADPLGDIVVPLLEYGQQDLPRYYEEYAAAQAAELQDQSLAEAADPEAEWHWDDAANLWMHFEGGEWQPQRSWDGERWHVLNRERDGWVPEEPEPVVAEEPEPVVYEEPVPVPAAEEAPPASPAEPAPPPVDVSSEVSDRARTEIEDEQGEDEEPLGLEELFAEESEPDGGAIADEILEAVVTEAAAEFEGFDDLTEEEFTAALNAVLDSQAAAAAGPGTE